MTQEGVHFSIRVLAALLLAGSAAGRQPAKRFDVLGRPIDLFLNYEVVGEGPCVIVALHGFGGALDTWDDIEKALEARCRFYVPDLIGFGFSARPNGFAYTVDEQADVVARFLEFVQQDAGAPSLTLIGHSYGGAVAITAYGKLKNSSIVSRLILLDSLVDPKLVHLPLPLRILRMKILNRIAITLVPSRTQVRLVLNSIYWNHFAVTTGVDKYAPFLRIPGTGAALIRTLHEYGNPAAARELSAGVHVIHIPTLIIWGRYDRLIEPQQAKKLAETIPGSIIKLVPAGHAPQEEVPEETARQIAEFLSLY